MNINMIEMNQIKNQERNSPIISKSEFDKIRIGDIVRFSNGKERRVLNIGNRCLRFQKLYKHPIWNTTTTYTYCDLYQKIESVKRNEVIFLSCVKSV
jgi:hypothetical protein